MVQVGERGCDEGAPQFLARESIPTYPCRGARPQGRGCSFRGTLSLRAASCRTYSCPETLTARSALSLCRDQAALVKHKRFKNAPKYNPAAERVRQRATWMEQVLPALHQPSHLTHFHSVPSPGLWQPPLQVPVPGYSLGRAGGLHNHSTLSASLRVNPGARIPGRSYRHNPDPSIRNPQLKSLIPKPAT